MSIFGSTCFGHSNNHITEIGSRVWVLKDYSRLISSNGFVGEFLKRNFCPDINVDELRRIELSFDGIKRDFVFGNQENIGKIEVTLKDLCISDNTDYPTKYNTTLDDVIVDKFDNEYTVIAKYDYGIDVKCKRELTGVDGNTFNITSKIYIPFPNSTYPDGMFTTRVFKKK